MLKPKSGLSTRKSIGAAWCHSESPRLHISMVKGLPVLKPKSGLSTGRSVGAAWCHFESPRLYISIVQGWPVPVLKANAVSAVCTEECPRGDNIHQGGHYSLENNVLGDTKKGGRLTLLQRCWYPKSDAILERSVWSTLCTGSTESGIKLITYARNKAILQH